MKGTLLPYFLDEDNAWGLKPAELEANIEAAKNEGVNARAIVVINPGNPTGSVLSI
jgi:alanine transaminase